MKKQAITFIFTILLILPQISLAHPGRTDSSGCHTCRTNCANWGLSTGEYHCHNAKALPQPEEPIHSKYGENGTGYTYTAPEYKSPENTITQPKAVQGDKVENTTPKNTAPKENNSNYAAPIASTDNQTNETDDNTGAVIGWLVTISGGAYIVKKSFGKK